MFNDAPDRTPMNIRHALSLIVVLALTGPVFVAHDSAPDFTRPSSAVMPGATLLAPGEDRSATNCHEVAGVIGMCRRDPDRKIRLTA